MLNFADDAKEMMARAQREARRLGHDYVGTEHILLALLEKRNSAGVRALDRLGVRLADIRSDVIGVTGRCPAEVGSDPQGPRALGIDLSDVRHGWTRRSAREHRKASRGHGARVPLVATPRSDDTPLTPRARRVLAFAREEAEMYRSGSIGTAHVLLGLLDEGEGVATDILVTRAGGAERIRDIVAGVISES